MDIPLRHTVSLMERVIAEGPEVQNHGHSSRHHHMARKKRVLVIVAAIFWVLLLAAVAFLPGKLGAPKEETVDRVGRGAELFDNAMRYQDGEETYVYRENDLTTVLLIGVDRPEMNKKAELTYRNGSQADFLVLLVIDRVQKKVTPIQIDRDTMTKVDVYGVFGNPAGNRVMQLCLAQGFGRSAEENCRNTMTAVSSLMLGIPVDHYFAYDFQSIGVMNDLLGGVPVTIEDDLSNLDPAMVKGAEITLMGSQAETFVRARMSVGNGTNAERMIRQRVYMDSALNRLRILTRDNSSVVSDILTALSDCSVTDMTDGYVINTVNRCLTYKQVPFVSAEGVHTHGEDGFTEFYPEESSLKKIVLDACFEKEAGTSL